MSCRLTTLTPFINREFLLKALDACQYKYRIKSNQIILEQNLSIAYYDLVFEQDHLGKFVLHHDSHTNIHSLLTKLEEQYRRIEQEYIAELERQRIAAEKAQIQAEQQRVEAARKRAILEQQRIEAEQKRLAEEKRIFVEKQKQAIQEKARSMGYVVKEVSQGQNVQLVLIRRTY